MRIALYSPDRLFAEALALIIQHQGHAREVKLVATPVAALAETDAEMPATLLLDVDRLSTADLELLSNARLRRGFGMVLLTRRTAGDYRHVGASLVLSLSDSAEQLFAGLQAISGLSTEPIPLSPRVGVYRDNVDLRLSRRELEVARLVAQGMSNRRIADVTGLREQSIKNLVSVVMRKLNCDNRVQVALKLVNAPVESASPASQTSAA